MPIRTPSYRFHKARNCAVVTLNGKDNYLGTHDSPESWEKYHRLIAEWLTSRDLPSASPLPSPAPMTVAELLLAYWKHAKNYYVKEGQPTSEQDTIRQALRFLRRLYGSTPAHEFTPKKLKAVRHAMAEHPITRRFKVRNPDTGEVQWDEKLMHHGLTRRFINKQVSRIRRMFAWAVEEELVPVSVHAALLRVQGLKKGKSRAGKTARHVCFGRQCRSRPVRCPGDNQGNDPCAATVRRSASGRGGDSPRRHRQEPHGLGVPPSPVQNAAPQRGR
jgi:hypothetical protein